MVHDIVLTLVVMFLVAAILGVAGPTLARLNLEPELARKIPHALCAIVLAWAVYAVDSEAIVLIVVGISAIGLVVAVEKKLIPMILVGSRARDYGFVGFALGLWFAVVLLWPDRDAIAAGLLVLGLADSAAAVIGVRYGRHRVRSSGNERSWEGAAAFVAVSFLITLAYLLMGFGTDVAVALSIAAFAAVTTASIELVVPSAADNLLITPWVALLLDVGHTASFDVARRWVIALVISYAVAPAIAKLRWLDVPGAVATALVAAGAVALGGWFWLAPVAVFFVSGSLLSKLRRTRSTKGLRKLRQVVVNGVGTVLIPVVGFALAGGGGWFWVSTGAIAAANADTWATEIGRLSRRPPVSLRTAQRVAAGTSGAVTLGGSIASVAGGLIIGVTGAAVDVSGLIIVGLVAGVLGSLVDSILGATVQASYGCPSCRQHFDDPEHCGGTLTLSSGVRWIDNDAVNALSNALGMGVAIWAYVLI